LFGPALLFALKLRAASIQLHAFRFCARRGQPKPSFGAPVVSRQIVLTPPRLLGFGPSGLRLGVEVRSMLASELSGGRPKERVRSPGRLLSSTRQSNGAQTE
jgi:hypothetical protein